MRVRSSAVSAGAALAMTAETHPRRIGNRGPACLEKEWPQEDTGRGGYRPCAVQPSIS